MKTSMNILPLGVSTAAYALANRSAHSACTSFVTELCVARETCENKTTDASVHRACVVARVRRRVKTMKCACPTPQTNLKHARCVGTDDAEDGARGERAGKCARERHVEACARVARANAMVGACAASASEA